MTLQLGQGVPPPPPPPWAAPAPVAPPRTVVTGKLVAFVSAGLALAVLAGYGLGSAGHHTAAPAAATIPFVRPAAPSPTPTLEQDPITAHSPLLSTSGDVFFTDDFRDPSSGWDTVSDKHVTTSYAHPGFRTTIHDDWDDIAASPNEQAVAQLGQTVRVRLSKGFGSYSAVGLSCERDFDKSNDMAYEFLVDSTGTWTIYRLNKANLTSSRGHLLGQGQTTAAGTTAITIGVDCVTLADGRTNRLLLFVNGRTAADLTNVSPKADEGWGGEMFNTGDDSVTTVVTASRYTESTLATDAVVGSPA